MSRGRLSQANRGCDRARRALAGVALAVCLTACSTVEPGPTGAFAVTLLPMTTPDPFDGVSRVSLALTNADGGTPVEVPIARGGRASLPPVGPAGGYRISFLGRDSAGTLLSLGRLPPVTLSAGPGEQAGILFGRVDRFSTFSQTQVGTATLARTRHTLTALRDGRALVLGGIAGDPESVSPTLVGSIALYEPRTATFRTIDGATFSGFDHTATELPDGRVLIAGGRDGNRTPVRSLLVFSPANATSPVSFAADLPEARAGHAATLLRDGTVLLSGGRSSTGAPLGTAHVVDVSSGNVGAALPHSPRAEHAATLLQDGRVLLTGGQGQSGVQDTAELYALGQGFSTLGARMRAARRQHTATVMGQNHVLLAGGMGTAGTLRGLEAFAVTSSSFVRVTDRNRDEVQMLVGRAGHASAPAGESRVLIAGGGDTTPGAQTATPTALIVSSRDDAATVDALEVELTNLANLAAPRALLTAVRLSDENVLVVGGASNQTALTAIGGAEVLVPR